MESNIKVRVRRVKEQSTKQLEELGIRILMHKQERCFVSEVTNQRELNCYIDVASGFVWLPCPVVTLKPAKKHSCDECLNQLIRVLLQWYYISRCRDRFCESSPSSSAVLSCYDTRDGTIALPRSLQFCVFRCMLGTVTTFNLNCSL